MSPATPTDALAALDEYDFELPEDSIAQLPAERRDAARLLVLDRESGQILASDPTSRVESLPTWLRPGDLLVLNATRVVPARLVGRKASGGAAEALLLGPVAMNESTASRGARYRALLKCTGRTRVGLEFVFGTDPGLAARIEAVHERGEVTLAFDPGTDPYSVGQAPLPPYIRRSLARDATQPDQRPVDLDRYQTIYAREPGAIAAPTAGLHMTDALFSALDHMGVERREVILHVGAGTFRPLEAEAFETGTLHSEVFELPEATAEAIDETRARGGRVIAVGTTTARVLESRATDAGWVKPGRGETDLFLHPDGATRFRVVDGLLTNFHLPRSSLLLLVAAFAGREPILAAYQQAIRLGFRFYSYGDAMFIRPGDGAGASSGG